MGKVFNVNNAKSYQFPFSRVAYLIPLPTHCLQKIHLLQIHYPSNPNSKIFDSILFIAKLFIFINELIDGFIGNIVTSQIFSLLCHEMNLKFILILGSWESSTSLVVKSKVDLLVKSLSVFYSFFSSISSFIMLINLKFINFWFYFIPYSQIYQLL